MAHGNRSDHRDRRSFGEKKKTRENFPDMDMDMKKREEGKKRGGGRKNGTPINLASYITRDRWRFPSYATGSFITRRGVDRKSGTSGKKARTAFSQSASSLLPNK
jgi:hypothetical protein